MNKCYVCMEETIYKSPCECKLFLCKDCFKKLLKNNIKICTICKNNFESKKILLSKCSDLKFRNSPKVKSVIIDLSEINISEEEEEEELSNNIIYNKWKKIMKCIIFSIFFIFILIFGNILAGTNIANEFHISLLIIIYGVICFLLIFLLFELIYCVYVITRSFLL